MKSMNKNDEMCGSCGYRFGEHLVSLSLTNTCPFHKYWTFESTGIYKPKERYKMTDLWICDHAGKCEATQYVWCRKPFKEGDCTCSFWNNPCTDYGNNILCVKPIPYKETKMEYEKIKEISLKAIIDAGGREDCQDFIDFTFKAMKNGYIWDSYIALEHAVKWMKTDFLERKGFIRKKQRELMVEVFVIRKDNFGVINIIHKPSTRIIIDINPWLNQSREFVKNNYS